jgi:hypothetical protein
MRARECRGRPSLRTVRCSTRASRHGSAPVRGAARTNPPLSGDVNVTVQMANVGLRRALTRLVGSEQQDDLGLILIAALNCQNTGAAGVVFDLDPPDAATTKFYVIDGIPDKSLSATLPNGFGGFTNVQPGTVTIKGTLRDTGRPIGSVSLVARPDVITQSRLVPRWPPPYCPPRDRRQTRGHHRRR